MLASSSDQWLFERLVCPADGSSLVREKNWLISEAGRRYPIVDDLPVLLRDDVRQTAWWLSESLEIAKAVAEGKVPSPRYDWDQGTVHPHVQNIVASTCGYLYRASQGKLTEYPIPDLHLSTNRGETMLDIGCNWGRWCFAAARRGLKPIGIDPSLAGVLAARDIARQLDLECAFVVGDARHLPFRHGSLDQCFSYSVLQHFSKPDARRAFEEIHRCLKPGGTTLVQMPNRFGIRSAFHLAKRGFSEGHEFDVRYYTPAELEGIFAEIFGNSIVTVDGYFGLGIQPSDMRFMSPFGRMVTRSSELLRQASLRIPVLKNIADSLYLESTKEP
jgi:SAM-dependent methyltransferase